MRCGICICAWLSLGASAFAQSPHFLRLPYADTSVRLQNGWLYTTGATPHRGLDYVKGGPDSTTWQTFDVVASADGVVSWSYADDATGHSNYGYLVVIRHNETNDAGQHYFTLYAHFPKDGIASWIPNASRTNTDFGDASKWFPVKAGQIIGRSGTTGWNNCSDHDRCIHLHFEVRVGAYGGSRIDPYGVNGVAVQYPGSCATYEWQVCPPTPEPPMPPPQPFAGFSMSSGAVLARNGETLSLVAPVGGQVGVILRGTATPPTDAPPGWGVTDWQWTVTNPTQHFFGTTVTIPHLTPGLHEVSVVATDSRGMYSLRAVGQINVAMPSELSLESSDGVTFGQMAIDSTGAVYVPRVQWGLGCGAGLCNVALQKIVPDAPASGWTSPALGSDSLAPLGLAVGPGDRVYFQATRNTLFAFEPTGTASPGGWPVSFPGPDDKFRINTLVDHVTGQVFGQTSSVGACWDNCSQFFGAFRATGEPMWSVTSTVPAGGFELKRMFLGPGGNVYSLTSREFVHYERETGIPVCSLPLDRATINNAVGSIDGIFSSSGWAITEYDADCSSRNILVAVGRANLTVRAVRLRMVLATDDLEGATGPGTEQLLAVSPDGPGWRLHEIWPDTGATVAFYGSTVYVQGRDSYADTKRKLYGVNVLFGNIVREIDLTGMCERCGLAVDPNGNLFINDLNSMKVFRIPYVP